MRALLTALALLDCQPRRWPCRRAATLPWTDPRPQPRGEALLRSAMIAGHNQARRRYGVAPLAWDEALARDAAVYAAAAGPHRPVRA